MRPKQATISQRTGGRARRGGSLAAACALVIATVAGCGGSSEPKAESTTTDADASAPGAAAGGAGVDTGVELVAEAFAADVDTSAGDAATAASAAFLPAYAVSSGPKVGTVDIKVGSHPFAVAVNSTTGKAYAANNYTNDVTVIDGKTNKTTTVKAGAEPTAVAINEKTDKVYVANIKGLDKHGNVDPNSPGTITVIDGKTNKTTTVKGALEPFAVGINEKTNKIYVANQGSNDLTVIDGKTNKTKTIALRPANATNIYSGILTPQDVKINTVTNRIYVTGSQSNTVAVIDGNTNKILSVLKTEGLPADKSAPTAKYATSQTGLTPTSIAIDETRNLIYTANFTSNDITVIDGKTSKGTIIPLVDVQDPYSIKVNPITNKIYTANLTSRSITIIDGATKGAVTIGDLPGKPHDAAINLTTNKIYFPSYVLYRGAEVGDDKQITGVILELDGKTNKITTIIAGITPYAVAVDHIRNKTYVMNQDSDTVTVVSGG